MGKIDINNIPIGIKIDDCIVVNFNDIPFDSQFFNVLISPDEYIWVEYYSYSKLAPFFNYIKFSTLKEGFKIFEDEENIVVYKFKNQKEMFKYLMKASKKHKNYGKR